MLDPLFFLISRLNKACSPLLLKIGIKDIYPILKFSALHASTTQRGKPSLVDINNFSYIKFKSTIIYIYEFINIAKQCFIILYN